MWRWRTRNLPFYPRRGTRDGLAKLFGELRFDHGLEIGTQYGRFAKVLLDSNPQLLLHCVDPYIPYGGISAERQASRIVQAKNLLAPYAGRVNMVRKTSMDALPDYKDSCLDFVYIDGNHEFEYAMSDLLGWAPKVRRGGIVALHDYHPHTGYDVVAAVEAYVRAKHIDPWYCTREEMPTAFWVKR